MNTTLYNHKEAGNGKKPLIPNIIFKSLVWLYDNKFYEDYEYLIQKYTLTPDQKQKIELINKINRKTNV